MEPRIITFGSRVNQWLITTHHVLKDDSTLMTPLLGSLVFDGIDLTFALFKVLIILFLTPKTIKAK